MLVSRELAERVARHVQNNNHGEAIVLAAKVIGWRNIAERMEVINRQHSRLGYLPQKLYEERRAIYEEMMRLAKKGLSPSDYERLYQAF